MHELAGLFLDRAGEPRVAMADRADGYAGAEV